MDGAKYWYNVQENLFQPSRGLGLTGRFTLQKDNDLKPYAKTTLGWFKGKQLSVFLWLCQDLNPMDNLSCDLKIALHQLNPFSMKEL